MRALVHEDGETKLTRADQHDGKNVGQRVGKYGHERHRSEDDGPRMGDEADTSPLDRIAQAGELLGRHELTSGDTVRSACGGRVHGNLPKLPCFCERIAGNCVWLAIYRRYIITGLLFSSNLVDL